MATCPPDAAYYRARLAAFVAGGSCRPLGACRKIKSPLLLTVVVRLLAVPIFLLGLYFVLQVAG